MLKPDYEDPAGEEKWCLERRAEVEHYLRSQGVEHGEIGEWPAWHVAPYVSIWAIESRKQPGWVGWWVIAGDLPTDYVSAGKIKHPREAMRALGSAGGKRGRICSAGESAHTWSTARRSGDGSWRRCSRAGQDCCWIGPLTPRCGWKTMKTLIQKNGPDLGVYQPMAEASRTVVTFRSDTFNTTEPRPHYINPECYGDDVANWLAEELKARGVEVDEPGQEDFGWYLNFSPAAGPHTLVLGYRPGAADEQGDWFGVLERSCGFLASLFGGRNKGVQAEAAELIHSVLAGSDKARDVRWYRRVDFEAGREEAGSAAP